MTYQQHLATAMVHLGDNDEAAALASFQDALNEAKRIDPDGPREAECLNYLAQFYTQGSRHHEARVALEKVAFIYEKFPEFAAGLADYYLQLMGLCVALGEEADAEAWRAKAKAVPAQDKPWR
jgi:tetratricopeptide (TPR) repeat protein